MSAAMTLPIAGQTLADPVEVYSARCWAVAWLWACGDYPDLIECVDRLWEAAMRRGVVQALGVDEAQAILSKAFAPFRAPNDHQFWSEAIAEETGVSLGTVNKARHAAGEQNYSPEREGRDGTVYRLPATEAVDA